MSGSVTTTTPAPSGGAFGTALTTIRHTRRLSQSRLANAARIDHSTVSRLEGGQRVPSRAMVLSLATALQATDAERDQLLGAAGYASDAPISDPLVAELDAMLHDEALPEIARLYLRAELESAVYRMRMERTRRVAA